MAIFTQIIILIIVLAAMVMVLLGIRQLTHFESFDDSEETDNLKKDLEDDGNILTQNNIFHNLVDVEKNKKEKIYKKTSKEPASRKE